MTGYVPLYDTMLTGTLFGRWPHTGIWACLLSRVSREGLIDEVPASLAAAIGVPVELLTQCINDFMKPDIGSRTKEHDGRRLALIDPNRDWGWKVLNHGKYREKARKKSYDDNRTENGYDADRKKAARENNTCPELSRDVPLSSPTPSPTPTPTPTPEKPKRTAAPSRLPSEFGDLQKIYPIRAGDQPWNLALQACNARIREGYTWQEILAGAERYAAFCTATGKLRTETVMQAKRFCGPSKPFLNGWELPATKAEAKQDKNISASQQWLLEQELADAAR